MSGLIPLGLTIALAANRNLLSPTLIRPRNIGGFFADVTIEENASDDIVITDHPVERGADISDHFYKRPCQVTIRTGWSGSSPQALGNPNYAQEVYQGFLALQRSGEPFAVVTGKRSYTNMMALKVMQTTNAAWENALQLTVECREVIIVNTQVTTLPSAGNMKTPQATAPVTNTGTKQLGAAPNFNASGP